MSPKYELRKEVIESQAKRGAVPLRVVEGQVRVAGYIRWSTDGQDNNETKELQQEAIDKYCRDNGYILHEIYIDEAISGYTTKKRQNFLKMKADAKAGLFQKIVVLKLDRFGRNLKEILINYDDFESYGVEVVSIKENLDTSNYMGRAMRNMIGLFTELERDTIKDRMHGGRNKKWKEGRTFIGIVPFGYRLNPETKLLEINLEEAEIVRRIYDEKDEGLSDNEIAYRLQKEGIKTRRGTFFSSPGIHYIIKNPAYYGNYIVNQFQYDGNQRVYEEKEVNGKTKKVLKRKPSSEHISIDIKSIVSKLKWDSANQRYIFNKVKGKRISIAQNHFLRDLLICGKCGGKFKPHFQGYTNSDGTSPGRYVCVNKQMTKKRLEVLHRTKCTMPSVKLEIIHDLVWNRLMLDLSLRGYANGEIVSSDLEKLVEYRHYDEQLKELGNALEHQKGELRRKQTAKERLYKLLETDDFMQEEFHQRIRKTDEEITQIKAMLADLQTKTKTLEEAKGNQVALINFVKNNRSWLKEVQKELYALSPADKKFLVEGLIPGGIEVQKEGPVWSVDFRIVFNQGIFEHLATEGKIKGFNKNGP